MKYKVIKHFPLRELMNHKGHTCRSLGKAAGVHYTYISRLLKGKSIATETMVEKLKKHLV